MKVYIVIDNYDCVEILGVYSTKEQAIEELNKNGGSYTFIEEQEII